MSSSIRKVALLAGSGRLGPHILDALKPNYEITVVTRKSSSSSLPDDINVARVSDGYPYDDIIPIFREQDAVVLCLNFQGFEHEVPLINISIDAGVKRTILNGYGGNEDNEEYRRIFPWANLKGQVLEATKKLAADAPSSWSWTSISNGLFFDKVLTTSMGSGRFFGLNPETRTARFMGDGNFKFSATNVSTIGQAVSKVLSKPEETANRTVYISSFEVSLHEILAAYKKATGTDDWAVTYVDVDEAIKGAQEKLRSGRDLMAIGTIAMATELKEEYGPNFASLGVLDNELLGLPQESVEETVAKVVKNGLKL